MPSDSISFIVGCGDIGRRVAASEIAYGSTVAALARSDAVAESLARRGISTVRGDLDHPAGLTKLPRAEILYYFAPPPPSGSDDPRLGNLLAALPADGLPRRVVYISTSGVYGDCGGAWIDEDYPVNPQTDRAKRRVAAETRLAAWCGEHGVAFVILRVPGIYGPGRLPEARVRQGLPVVREDEAPYSNRIHADDLAAVCVAAARRGRSGGIYNVSDGHPTTMTDYFSRIADKLGLPRPPQIGLEEARRVLTPAMLSFLEESKRLVNRRMIEELGVALRYPNLERGLEGC